MGNILYIYVNQTTLKHKSQSLYSYSELARTLFPAENTNNIKIKITCHNNIGDECIWEGISLTNAYCVSQPVTHEVLNANDGVFKRESLMGK